jgi:hypothetical protein
MKRVLVLLSVVALMVVMLAMSVAPALASAPTFRCYNPDTGLYLQSYPFNGALHYMRDHGYTDCQRL